MDWLEHKYIVIFKCSFVNIAVWHRWIVYFKQGVISGTEENKTCNIFLESKFSRLNVNKLNCSHFFFDCLICIPQLKDHKAKDGTLSPKGLKAQKKTKPPDTAGAEINILLFLRNMSVLKLWCTVELIRQTQQRQNINKSMILTF